MAEVFSVNISESMDLDHFEVVLDYIPEKQKYKINRLNKLEDRIRSLIGEILSRYIISLKLNINAKDVEILTNGYGKPLLADSNNLFFNVSHSEDWVVCAFDTNVIGIDIEKIEAIDFDLAELFFSNEEIDDLLNIREENRIEYFYDLWTLKESYIKALGKGLTIPLNKFTIKRDNSNSISFKSEVFEMMHFSQIYIDPDFKLSICTKKKETKHKYFEIPLSKLLKLFSR